MQVGQVITASYCLFAQLSLLQQHYLHLFCSHKHVTIVLGIFTTVTFACHLHDFIITFMYSMYMQRYMHVMSCHVYACQIWRFDFHYNITVLGKSGDPCDIIERTGYRFVFLSSQLSFHYR
jgi:hypothetical protein